jgi:uncharacterized membrane protein (UPF0127 family)
MNNITKKTSKLIKNMSLIIVTFLAFSSVNADVIKGEMQNTRGEKITLRFAITKAEHTQGLSGLKSNEFTINEGMLFVNGEVAPRKFWMPDTYFDLDIIFLDANLKIVGIERNALAHPGMTEPPEIFKTQIYNAQFILETKANSNFSKKIKVGQKLKFIGKPSLSEIVLKTRLVQ